MRPPRLVREPRSETTRQQDAITLRKQKPCNELCTSNAHGRRFRSTLRPEPPLLRGGTLAVHARCGPQEAGRSGGLCRVALA